MSFIEKLYNASFDGVSFLAPSESVERGKKYAVHEYPNTDIRYVEELGKLQPIFTITAIVHGDDALNQRIRLENALEQSGVKDLVHPVYGALKVKSLDYSVSSDQTSVGQFTFSIRFARSRENVTPAPETPTNSTITGQSKTVRDNLDNKLEDVYTPPTTAENYTRFVTTLQNTFNSVHNEIKKVVNLSTTGAARFSRVYRAVTNNITSIVSSGETLKQNITLFYDAALDAAIFPEQLSAAWDRLTTTPLEVTNPPITRDQSIRQQNDYAITEHLKLTALANSYESKVYTDYTTDVSLADARLSLNTNYKNNLNRNNEEIKAIGLESIANDSDVRLSFADLRTLSRKVFDDKEKAVFRIVTINPGTTSMPLMVYRYYGNLDLINQLITLNPEVKHANFSAEVKALTG